MVKSSMYVMGGTGPQGALQSFTRTPVDIKQYERLQGTAAQTDHFMLHSGCTCCRTVLVACIIVCGLLLLHRHL